MKLTLRKARKLEGKIATKIGMGISQDVCFSAHDSGTLDDISKKLELAHAEAQIETNTLIALTVIRSSIRRSIQKLNEESGINNAISDRKQALDIITIWKDTASSGDGDLNPISPTIIEGKLKSLRENPNPSSYSTRDLVQVSVINEVLVTVANGYIITLEKLIEKLDDDILELNMSVKVEIPDSDVDVLRSANLL